MIQGKETLVGDILEGTCLSAFSRVFLKNVQLLSRSLLEHSSKNSFERVDISLRSASTK